MKGRIVLSTMALFGVLVVGVAYLLVYVVQLDPTARTMTVHVELAQSGGLLGRSDVTYRGYRIGNVQQILLRPGGVGVDVEIAAGTQIPVDTDVVVASLSAAGEQYLDFRPRTDSGPYLADGAVIPEKQTTTPVPFAQLLAHVSTLAAQVDPKKLSVVVDELAKAFHGTGPALEKILDGGDFLLAGLQGVLPQTVSILKHSSITLDTVVSLKGDLTQLGSSGSSLGEQLKKSDPEIRALLDKSPGAFDLVDSLIKENQPTMAALLGDLSTVSELVSVRVPAISAFLPALADAGNALTMVVRNGAAQTLVDIYPRPSCDYETPRRPPTIGGSPPPLLNVHCTDADPTVQQRGAGNAPRPPGDDTAGPPPGSTGHERAGLPAGSTAMSPPDWLAQYLKSIGQ